jgi:hypothetical protein
MLLALLMRTFCLAGESSSARPSATALDYQEPKLLIGKIFAQNDPTKLLFKSQRTATRTGQTVSVVCEYSYPDGSLAARERIIYEAGQLALFEVEELQTGEKGSAVLRSDERNPGGRKIFFDYIIRHGEKKRTRVEHQGPESEILVNDMIPGFIASHWEALMRGSTARFRFIALSREETVGFKLTRGSEATSSGMAAIWIKMEPTSIIIARLVEPIHLLVEANGAHRILEYVGRTTPLIKSGNKWKDLDARTIFEWR